MNEQENKWVTIFDPQQAIASMFNHLDSIASSRTTRTTQRLYRGSLYDYLEFCGASIKRNRTDNTRIDGDKYDFSAMRLHTEEQMMKYIRYCKKKGRSAQTIHRYIAPIRLYLDALRQQHMPAKGEHRYFILEAKEQIEMAQRYNLPPRESEPVPDGITITEARECFRSIERTSLIGKRNAALFYLAHISKQSFAAIYRMKLADADNFDKKSRNLIKDYVDSYNATLTTDDTRRITNETALWQPIRRGNTHEVIAKNNLSVKEGLSYSAVALIVHRIVTGWQS